MDTTMTAEDVPLAVRYAQTLKCLGNREPSTTFEMEAVLDGIRHKKCYLDDTILEDVQAMRESSRQTILHLVEKSKETEACYTKSVSEQLYSSKYRFLYELIQNADDSDFSIAKRSNKHPYVHFKVTPSTLVFETNEDGFTRAKIEAICAAETSSKKASASDNYIGEKGFGFKSVFSVAHQVHVQSGLWSLQFKHKQGDDGLGMVTPLNASSRILPSNVVTRITLLLSDTSASSHQGLLEAVVRIPKTTVLHLHNLRRVTVTKRSDDCRTATSVWKSSPIYDSWGKAVSLHVQTKSNGQLTSSHENKFYMFARHLTSMPRDDRRRNRTSATVELAFPIEAETQKPKLSASGQHVFAYLPLHELPIQFIIQSDFITSASRDSLIECAWNDALRTGIAEAFCEAVGTFATRSHPLRHLWLEYLPKDTMENNFWQQLYPLIKSRLQHMPVLQTWEGGVFRPPLKLRRIANGFIHRGSPLFRDTSDRIYLAKEYDHSSKGLAAALGVPIMSYSEEISRIEADLVRSDSWLKSPATLNSWHRACARKILGILNQGHKTISIHHRIRRLAIIPIEDGRSWTCAPMVDPGKIYRIYFPHTDGIPVPSEFDLNMVQPAAISVPERKELFRNLGVQECSKDEVLSMIEEAHRFAYIFGGRTENVLEELRYLFHFHPHPESLRSWMLIPLSTSKFRRVSEVRPLYFLSAKEYSAQKLLPKRFTKGVCELSEVADFVSEELSELEGSRANSQGCLWRDWLELATGASDHPVLLQHSGTYRQNISETILEILQHSPMSFVGMLKAHWNEYKKEFHLVLEQLQSLKVPCTFGSSHELQGCYLPATEIVLKIDSLRARPFIPVLQLSHPCNQETRHEWEFLGELGVKLTIDLGFYTTIHQNELWRDQSWGADLESSKDILVAMYTGMAGLVTANDYGYHLRRELGGIIGHISDSTPCFTKIEKYVWQGPNFLTTKIPLEEHYGHVPLLENFFKVALNIPNCSLMDIIEELKLGSLNACSLTREQWKEMYRFLNDKVRSYEDMMLIRMAFIVQKLVWTPEGKMYSLGKCLWTSPFPLAGYVELSRFYPDLMNFFVKQLGVQDANPVILIEEIKKMAEGHSPQVDIIQRRLVDIGRLFKSGISSISSKALDSLGQVKFLPKILENGCKTLVGKDDDFAINDHPRFADAFKGQYILIDFSVEEVHVLSKLFGHWGLNDRYLSQAVRKESTVGDDAIEHEVFTNAFRSKAYALYCCAAQYKSMKALRDDIELFDHLSDAQVYVTDSINTDLVINFGNRPLKVQSDRPTAHHELVHGQLKLYLPNDARRSKSCYRSQFPQLLARIMYVPSNATQAISEILSCDLLDLDEILFEHDIGTVDWIQKPTYSVPDSPSVRPSNGKEPPTSPAGHREEIFEWGTSTPPSSTTTGVSTPAADLGDGFERSPTKPSPKHPAPPTS